MSILAYIPNPSKITLQQAEELTRPAVGQEFYVRIGFFNENNEVRESEFLNINNLKLTLAISNFKSAIFIIVFSSEYAYKNNRGGFINFSMNKKDYCLGFVLDVSTTLDKSVNKFIDVKDSSEDNERAMRVFEKIIFPVLKMNSGRKKLFINHPTKILLSGTLMKSLRFAVMDIEQDLLLDLSSSWTVMDSEIHLVDSNYIRYNTEPIETKPLFIEDKKEIN